jgi:hypothetical protein
MGVSKEPRPGARRPRAQIAAAGRVEKQLGSLPVIADFSRRLDIAGVVGRACPMRDVGALSHGQVIEALIANRLTSPKAMVAVDTSRPNSCNSSTSAPPNPAGHNPTTTQPHVRTTGLAAAGG